MHTGIRKGLAIMGLGVTVTCGAQTVEEFRGATATMRTPCLIDNTDAMTARERFFEQPRGVMVIPNIFERKLTHGPRGVYAPQDIVGELFGGSGYFPGPAESGGTPGDPNLAVGPTHTVAVINGRLQFHLKNGTLKTNVTPSSFFSGLAGASSAFDPRCWYDPYLQRFWIMYDSSDGSTFSYILIALSDDNNPEGTWAKWSLNYKLNGSTDSGRWADYPGFGGDQNIIMVTANMFSSSGSAYGKVRVMPKQQFVNGSSTITYTDFWSSNGVSDFSLQPARHIGTSAQAFLAAQSGSNRVAVYGVNNPLGTPTLTRKTVTVTSYASAAAAVQKGVTTTLDTLDLRIFDVSCRDNKLLVTHNISPRSQVRWYQINTAAMPGGSPTVTQQGNITDATGYLFYGALHMNQYGSIGTAVTKTSANDYVTLSYTGREAGDATGTMKPLTVFKTATLGYNGESPGSTVRWGDYQGGALDPSDDFTFWAIAMIPSSSSAWRTEIFSFTIGTQPSSLNGTVDLQQFGGNKNGLTATLEFRTPGTTTVVFSNLITLNAGGGYTIPTVPAGTYDVAVKFSHWLRAKFPSKVIAGGVNTVDFSLINGDAAGTNTVDLFGLNAILGNFGTADAQSDLDGSGVVDLFDMNIVLGGFGLAGEA